MSSFRARPYARALFDVLKQPRKAEAALPQLDALVEAISGVPQLRMAMESPALPQERKTQIFDEVLSSMGITEPIRRFAHVLQQHYRLKFVEEIVSAFRDLINRALGRVDARIEIPAPLPPDEQQQLLDAMQEITGAEILAEFVENTDLLAGFRIQIGSKVFDASVDGQLKHLSRKAQQI